MTILLLSINRQLEQRKCGEMEAQLDVADRVFPEATTSSRECFANIVSLGS